MIEPDCLSMGTVVELREQFELAPNCDFVDIDNFIEKLTSHQRWERADEPAANLLGLVNSTSGNRVYIPNELFNRRFSENIK